MKFKIYMDDQRHDYETASDYMEKLKHRYKLKN